MKIDYLNNPVVTFEECQVGNVYLYEGKPCMKILVKNDFSHSPYHIMVDLETGITSMGTDGLYEQIESTLSVKCYKPQKY